MKILDRLTRIFARETTPTEPHERVLFFGRSDTGIRITTIEDALRMSAIWACVRVISETLAGLPWNVMQRQPNGDELAQFDHPVSQLLSVQPNDEMTSFVFREVMTISALLWGDAYAEIERENRGRPLKLWPIEPHRVTVERDDGGNIVYRINNGMEPPSFIPMANMFHVKGPGPNGLVGYYVIALFGQLIGLGLASEKHAGQFFGQGAKPSGMLKHPGTIQKEEAEKLIQNFEAHHLGGRRTGLLHSGLDWVDVSTTNEDSELKETRTFQVLEACRIFRVPPHKVAELSRATFSNISEQETAFARETIIPWAIRYEQEANWKLFSPTERRRLRTNIDEEEILRGDNRSHAEYVEILSKIPVFKVNELRKRLKMPLLEGEEGEKVLVNQAFSTLDQIANPAEPPEPPPQIEQQQPEQLALPAPADVLRGVFEDACGRVIWKEIIGTKDAIKRFYGKPTEFHAWHVKFYQHHQAYVMNQLAPAVEAWQAMHDGVGNTTTILAVFAKETVWAAHKEVKESPAPLELFDEWAKTRRKTMAAAILSQLETLTALDAA